MRPTFRFVSAATIAACLASPLAARKKTTGPKERYEWTPRPCRALRPWAAAQGRHGRGDEHDVRRGPDNAIARQLFPGWGQKRGADGAAAQGRPFFSPPAKLANRCR